MSALDRAANAARTSYLAAPRTRGMDPLPLWRPVAAAALRVMADDIRALHKPAGLTYVATHGSWQNVAHDHCSSCHWETYPCPTVRVLDSYTGGSDA